MTFEEKIAELESIIAKLENESNSLENSIELYIRAKNLSKELNEELQESIKKAAYIVENGTVKEFDPEKDAKKDI